MRTRRLISFWLLLAASLAGIVTGAGRVAATPPAPLVQPAAASIKLTLPNRDDSLKFAVLGDFGNGSRQQYELGERMAEARGLFPFEFVITVGDNIYGSDNPGSLKRRFEDPYKKLLDAGVKFYASLGNHDSREVQRYYKLFNMGGEFYYSFKAPKQDVRFFALESGYMNVEHIGWLERELARSSEKWQIPYFHHPLYSSGGRHGSDTGLRDVLEPLFLKHNVTVVFAGHDHFYERTKPQNGIVHFVVGSGGQLRRGNVDKRSLLKETTFDTDQAFLAAEIDGDELFINAVSRAGQVVDSAVIRRRQQP